MVLTRRSLHIVHEANAYKGIRFRPTACLSLSSLYLRKVMAWFKGQATDFYDSGIQKLVPRLNKCLDNAGDYVEK